MRAPSSSSLSILTRSVGVATLLGLSCAVLVSACGDDTDVAGDQNADGGSTSSSGDASVATCTGDTWDDDGNPATPCAAHTVCAAGQAVAKAGTATNDRTCTACASGTYSTSQNAAACTTWTDCAAGTFATAAGATTADRTCAPCAPGTFSAAENQSACTAQGTCQGGTQQTAPATSTSDAVCASCEAGTYCPGGDTPLAPCEGDTWDDDISAASACVPHTICIAGQHVTANGDALGDRTCEACADGSFSLANNAAACDDWTSCDLETYVTTTPSSTRDRSCSDCAPGTFAASANASVCTEGIHVDGSPLRLFVGGTAASITLTNPSQTPVSGLAVTLPAGASLTISSNTCGATLAPGASCLVSFTPGASVESVTVSIASSNVVATTATVNVVSFVGAQVAGGVGACPTGLSSGGALITGAASTPVIWGDPTVNTFARSNTDGAANTATIVSTLGAGTYAAEVCSAYEIDSAGNSPCAPGLTCYDDWFLPAIQQLDCLYDNHEDIGGFQGQYWWSSTEFAGNDSMYVYIRDFQNGNPPVGQKSNVYNARCVRVYTP